MSISDLTNEEIVALPVDDLALRLLDEYAATRHFTHGSIGNWMVGFVQNRNRPPKPTVDALNEGWSWLFGRGLLALDYEKHTTLHAAVLTRLGERVMSEGLSSVRATVRLDMDLHPIIDEKAKGSYLQGKYGRASFDAMKAVEIRVKELSGEPKGPKGETLYGVALMRHAFAPEGLLASTTDDRGEVVARMELFAGGIGVFKNPGSHSEVEIGDPTEAAEIILFADLLMRILDHIEQDELGA
jgi:uncharacterized protein (TIGR02391 family)